ncbi:MAG: suppressor of fused domain protein [Solirubrobacteraceae bacterium]|nr:suppressor of fused domain protein [Solirubrobacteraceae bacterium]
MSSGIDVHRGDDELRLVTFGLAGLAGPPPRPDGTPLGDPGHELTILTPPAAEPPEWAARALLGAARTCAMVGRWLHPGARLAPAGPIDGRDSALVAWGVRHEDPVEEGGPPLLLLVGVTAGEYALMRRVGTDVVLDGLLARDGRLRTDPARR